MKDIVENHSPPPSTLSNADHSLACWAVTSHELSRIGDHFPALARRLGVDLASGGAHLQVDRAPREAYEASFGPSLSRHSIRLALKAYAAANAYENVCLGLLHRKSARDFVRGLRSRTSLRLAGAVTAYSVAYRALFRILRPEFSLRPSAALPAFLAGALASLALVVEPVGRWRGTIVVYLLTRALVAAWRAVARLDALGGPGASRTAVQGGDEAGLKRIGGVMRDGRWWCGPHLVFG